MREEEEDQYWDEDEEDDWGDDYLPFHLTLRANQAYLDWSFIVLDKGVTKDI